MRWLALLVGLSAAAALGALACHRTAPVAGDAGDARTAGDAGDARPGVDAAAGVTLSPSVSAAASVSAAVATPVAKGTVRFVLQHVEAVCGDPEGRHFSVGTDVLVETADEGEAKPFTDFAFCPKRLADGGLVKPRLDTWMNCKAFAGCKEVSAEGSSDVVELACGKDHITIDTSSGRTILKGAFGERELSPFPMRILPTKRTRRDALVDC